MDNGPSPARFLRLLQSVKRRPNGCWEWTGKADIAGYGPYRSAWLAFRGEVPDGLTIDHACHSTDKRCAGGFFCRHRRCINPWHMELVPHRENVLRGQGPTAQNARKTHCPQGHPYEGDNVLIRPDGARRCRACNAEHQRQWRQRKQEAS